ncbi:MAG: alpha/beta hydrolase [Gammaproteobacteria bacterium]
MPPRDTFAVAGSVLEIAREPGHPGAPTLLLLHEGLGCVALWKQFPRALAEATGCPVLSYSRAGYGASSAVVLPRPLDFHSREAVDVLPAVLDAAGCGPCVLVGHSDGASIALVHAGVVRDPRVRGVAVLAPHVLTENKTLTAIAAAQAAYQQGGLRERLARYHGANVDGAFRGWAETWLDPGFRSWSIEAALAAIEVPVLAIRGEDDPYNTSIHLERIAALVKGPVTTAQLSECGHAPQVEQPATVLELLRDFVMRLAAAR